MLVVDVCATRVPSAFRMSVGRPVPESVIAANDAHVPAAYRSSVSPSAAAAPAGAINSAAHASATAQPFHITTSPPSGFVPPANETVPRLRRSQAAEQRHDGGAGSLAWW